MEKFNAIEAVVAKEQAIFECMDWMRNEIKETIENLMEKNKEKLKQTGNNLYCEGFYNALIEIAYALEIEIDKE